MKLKQPSPGPKVSHDGNFTRTILESHGKVMGFLSSFKKSWKTDISRQKSWKSHEILPQTISSVHDMWLWQSSSSSFWVIMVAAVRGFFSFMIKVYF